MSVVLFDPLPEGRQNRKFLRSAVMENRRAPRKICFIHYSDAPLTTCSRPFAHKNGISYDLAEAKDLRTANSSGESKWL